MRNHSGISLIESLLAVTMIGTIIALMANLPNALILISKSSQYGLVREIATKQIEDKRALGFANLANDSTAILDSRLSQLPSGSGLVIIEDCPSQICPNGEQVKQVTVTINWKENNKTQDATIRTFIGEGGIN